MKSTFKKMLALLLALVMVTSVFVGCDNTTPAETTDPNAGTQTQSKETDPVETEPQLEPVTLKWYLFATEKEGSKDVAEAFNAKLATVLPNTKVEFIYGGTTSTYATNWPLELAAENGMDIAWAGYMTNFLQDTKDGNLLVLDDLIAQYAPNIQADKEIFAKQYTTGVYEGQTYGIPCIQPVIKSVQYISFDEEFYDKYLDSAAFVKEIRSSTKLTYKMLDIIEEGIEAAIADGHIKPGDTDYSLPNGLVYATRGYLQLGEEKYHLWIDPNAEDPEPMHMYELPEVQMLLDRYAKWYDLGWYSDKQILEGIANQKINVTPSNVYNGTWVGRDKDGVVRNDNSAKGKRNNLNIALQKEEETYIGAANYGFESSYFVIPYTSENPERAMMLIDLLHDEVGTVGNELYNMLAFGFAKDSAEAQKYGWFNYAVTESADGQNAVDKTARGDAPEMHSAYNWTLGNTYRSLFDGTNLLTVAYKEYCMNYYSEVYPTLKKSLIADMLPDTSVVANELAAMLNVEAEYGKQLGYGTAGEDGIDELYDKAMAAMYVAGLNIVKAELKDQIDDWIAANKK